MRLLKLRVRVFKKIIWSPKKGLLFLPENLQWKLVNYLTCHHSFRGKGPPKITRMILQRNYYKANGLLLSHLIIKQLPRSSKNPAGPGTYPGEDWQMDFTQMSVSQGYKYLLVMIDIFTGWVEGFPTWTEKVEEVVKKIAAWNYSEIWSAQVITKWQWDIISF